MLEKKLTRDGREVTLQEYKDEVKAELEKLRGLSDEELDAQLEESLDKEPESPFKNFAKVLLAELNK